MPSRHRFLRMFCTILLILGVVVMVGATLVQLGVSVTPTYRVVGSSVIADAPPPAGEILSRMALGWAAGLALIFVAQLTTLLIQLEENTHATANALAKLALRRSERS